MFKCKKRVYKPLPKEKLRYKQCPSVEEDQHIQACNPSKDSILPQGDLWSQLVSVPENIPFTEALEKVRQSMQNIQGTFKTITVEKNALVHNCIKRYFVSHSNKF